MKKELLLAVAKRLHTELNKPLLVAKYGKMDYIARFRNQFNNPDETIPPLAIAIEFPPATYSNRAKQQQEVTFTIRIHLHCRSLLKQRLDISGQEISGLSELEYQEEIHKILHGWNPECFTTLSRVDQSEDITYDFAIDDTISFETTATDVSADKRSAHEEVEVDLEVKGDVIPPPESHETPYKFETH